MPEKRIIAHPLTPAPWRSLPALLLLSVGCGGPAAVPSACDGLAEKTFAITKPDYKKCAGEILKTLEQLESSLGQVANGDAAAKDPADSASRRLAHLIGEAGVQADAWREAKDGAGRTIQRWPDAAMREFNASVVNAAAQFNAVLRYPNQDNLQQASRLHAQARSAYSRF